MRNSTKFLNLSIKVQVIRKMLFLFLYRSSHPKVFCWKGVLKICSKFTGEHPCRSAISIKLLCNFIEIILPHGCSPVNLLHIFRTPFPKNTSERLLLSVGGMPYSRSNIPFKMFYSTYESEILGTIRTTSSKLTFQTTLKK